MPRIVEIDGRLEIHDHMLPLKRLLLLLISLVPLLAPYELLILPKWHTYLNPYFVFAALVSFGALVVSGFFIWAASAGLNSLMRFDKLRKTFTSMTSAPIVPLRKHEYPIGDIRAIGIETHEWSEGAPSYSLRVEMADGRAFTSGSSWSQPEIEAMKERVASFLGQ